ncbi:hypothetical protein AQI95_34620 [Streptomyces yokosukanensis]|uniref:Uncharacterized protein n=1 Tax=Streptomyces yokosukanensis TaxID=67386 RepID=A0A101NW46_9ACTN|nr:hypothetical protein [Streptomyces yokosukanensis]KUN00435.1 hypothetical protein AQI95_34620 [Streptomyces yokosukanensis]
MRDLLLAMTSSRIVASMHLVHVELRSTQDRGHLDGASAALMAYAEPHDALEHVSVAMRPPGRCTLGLFFSSTALADAESAALRLTLRALRSDTFAGFAVVRCEAALVAGPLLWGDPPTGR